MNTTTALTSTAVLTLPDSTLRAYERATNDAADLRRVAAIIAVPAEAREAMLREARIHEDNAALAKRELDRRADLHASAMRGSRIYYGA